jgi:ribonuclease PH
MIGRSDNRRADEGRPVRITRRFTDKTPGSVLMEVGGTRVLCTAMVEEKVPSFMRGEGRGWVTAEYEMLPSSTWPRKSRDRNRGKIDGRTVEIQRLIGRSLRSVVELESLGERTVWIDCDVLQADGGTRTASITGAYIALYDVLADLKARGVIKTMPLTGFVAAVSVGIWQDEPILDLCYAEDSTAEVDMNLVMTDAGELIEIQGTGEARPFTRDEFTQLMALGEKGIAALIAQQKTALGI